MRGSIQGVRGLTAINLIGDSIHHNEQIKPYMIFEKNINKFPLSCVKIRLIKGSHHHFLDGF